MEQFAGAGVRCEVNEANKTRLKEALCRELGGNASLWRGDCFAFKRFPFVVTVEFETLPDSNGFSIRAWGEPIKLSTIKRRLLQAPVVVLGIVLFYAIMILLLTTWFKNWSDDAKYNFCRVIFSPPTFGAVGIAMVFLMKDFYEFLFAFITKRKMQKAFDNAFKPFMV